VALSPTMIGPKFMTSTPLSSLTNSRKKIAGQPYSLPRLGVGDKIRIGLSKSGTIVERVPKTADKSGSTTVLWKGGDRLTYRWDDWPKMVLIWEGDQSK
jgi:hypothetical protein